MPSGLATDLRERFPDAVIQDAGTSHVMPGLIDAQGHLMDLGFALLRADLMDTTSKTEIIARLQAYARDLPADTWVIGRGWDQNDWPDKEFPTAADLDGALGSRGAALIEDYCDEPGHRGLMLMCREALDTLLAKVNTCRLQAATHAVGDAANRKVLDGYATVLGADAASSDHRWRIEHAQVVTPADLPTLRVESTWIDGRPLFQRESAPE